MENTNNMILDRILESVAKNGCKGTSKTNINQRVIIQAKHGIKEFFIKEVIPSKEGGKHNWKSPNGEVISRLSLDQEGYNKCIDEMLDKLKELW